MSFQLPSELVAERYSGASKLRAAVQCIPVVGGVLDTLIGGAGDKVTADRVEHFLASLSVRLERVEAGSFDVTQEAMQDLLLTAMQQSARTRSAAKRARFAGLVGSQIERAGRWEEAECAFRLISELDDIHIEVLVAALDLEPSGGAFDGLQVFTLRRAEDVDIAVPLLPDLLPHYGEMGLRLACTELHARNLLHDEGIGRWDTRSLTYFVPTETARWLISWISAA